MTFAGKWVQLEVNTVHKISPPPLSIYLSGSRLYVCVYGRRQTEWALGVRNCFFSRRLFSSSRRVTLLYITCYCVFYIVLYYILSFKYPKRTVTRPPSLLLLRHIPFSSLGSIASGPSWLTTKLRFRLHPDWQDGFWLAVRACLSSLRWLQRRVLLCVLLNFLIFWNYLSYSLAVVCLVTTDGYLMNRALPGWEDSGLGRQLIPRKCIRTRLEKPCLSSLGISLRPVLRDGPFSPFVLSHIPFGPRVTAHN